MGAGGRPPKFKEEYKEQALKLCSKGFTDSDLANFWNVDERTVNNWKTKYPEFFQSLKDGKQFCDEEIEKSLFNRAKGYTVKEVRSDANGGSETVKELPPDTTACIFWLKNRKPKEWRDKVETDITTKGDKIESVQFYLPDNNRDN
jgi:hypothetical protein